MTVARLLQSTGDFFKKAIEEQTTTWDKTVIGRQGESKNWVVVLRRLVEDKRIRKVFAFANNHLRRECPGDREIIPPTLGRTMRVAL